jgi:hypothetical protein
MDHIPIRSLKPGDYAVVLDNHMRYGFTPPATVVKVHSLADDGHIASVLVPRYADRYPVYVSHLQRIELSPLEKVIVEVIE